MSHIHLPDGVLPFLWWAGGLFLCLVVMFFLVRNLKGEDVRRKVPFVGVLSALMLITMSVPLGIVPVHLSLAVLLGILAGPGLGFLAVFVVNVIMAFFGHGGITVVGINTLILGSEVVLGAWLFRFLGSMIRKIPAAVVSVIAALLVSTAMMVGFLGATVGWVEALPHQHDEDSVEWSGVYQLDTGTYRLSLDGSDDASMLLLILPGGEGEEDGEEVYHGLEDSIIPAEAGAEIEAQEAGYRLELTPAGTSFTLRVEESGTYRLYTGHLPEETDMQIQMDGDVLAAADTRIYQAYDEEGFFEALGEVEYLLFTGWSAVIAILLAGIALEAFITALIVRFFLKVRPDLVRPAGAMNN